MNSPYPTSHNSFAFSIVTTEVNETFTLPLSSGYTYNFTANWGDGSENSKITSYDDADRIHTYALAGTYIISMYGVCESLYFNNSGDKLKVIEILDCADLGFIRLNFYGCGNLTTISANLKRLKSLITAQNMFRDCSLTSIPAGIFNGSIGILDFSHTFDSCSTLTSIPTDLFRYNINVTSFDYTFAYCTNLATIPNYLFRYNVLATLFYRTFISFTAKRQLNTNIFYADGEQSTRFLNQSVNFNKCFYFDTFTGIQGVAPDLWNCNFGSGTPTKTDCYGGDGNSLTSLSNYNDIPVEWL